MVSKKKVDIATGVYEAAVARTKSSTTEVIPVVINSIVWTRSVPDSFLDWVYLDTSHSYEDTLN